MGQLDRPAAQHAHPTRATGAARRIYQLLRGLIAEGSLSAGMRVPSTRAMAADQGVSRTTVTVAYEQLVAEGYLVTSAGRVARVAQDLAAPMPPSPRARRQQAPAPRLSAQGRRVVRLAMPTLPPAEPVPLDFLYGAVAPADFPVQAWRRAYHAELAGRKQHDYYAAPAGEPALRRALQGYLRRARGLFCEADQIVIVNGSQQGIDLCARLLLDAGDAFVFEDPGYAMARHCFTATGARLLATPVDEHGLDTAQLPAAPGVRLAYVTPAHQFPLGGVLPVGRRRELLQWAQRQRAWIVEDDYDGEFRYGQRPIDALQALDTRGQVIHVGTFSKALSPQLRLGYLVLPPPLVPTFVRAKRLTDRHAPRLEQSTLAALIASGAYERHVRRLRREHERRRAALLQAVARHLPAPVQVAGDAAGLHLVLWLPEVERCDEAMLVAEARRQGVGVYPVTPLYAARSGPHLPRCAGLVVGYAPLSPLQIDQGMRRLGTVLAGRRGPGHRG